MPALYGEACLQVIDAGVRSLSLSSYLGHIKRLSVVYALWVQRDTQ
ncbi:MAG: hypothetical protein ACI9SP_000349 [Arenicella sp.]|jgi:hypothetical protein